MTDRDRSTPQQIVELYLPNKLDGLIKMAVQRVKVPFACASTAFLLACGVNGPSVDYVGKNTFDLVNNHDTNIALIYDVSKRGESDPNCVITGLQPKSIAPEIPGSDEVLLTTKGECNPLTVYQGDKALRGIGSTQLSDGLRLYHLGKNIYYYDTEESLPGEGVKRKEEEVIKQVRTDTNLPKVILGKYDNGGVDNGFGYAVASSGN